MARDLACHSPSAEPYLRVSVLITSLSGGRRSSTSAAERRSFTSAARCRPEWRAQGKVHLPRQMTRQHSKSQVLRVAGAQAQQVAHRIFTFVDSVKNASRFLQALARRLAALSSV